MATPLPGRLSIRQRRARRNRVARIARELGFAGIVEYRHVYSQTGGAQYGRGRTDDEDLLTVFAEAFERDANPEDFSLEAMIAHERGHQMLIRHPRIAKRMAGVSLPSEEILASLLGAIVCRDGADKAALYGKAAAELLVHGLTPDAVNHQLQELWDLLEALL